MKIQQFEKNISKVILKRGKDYYQNGAIDELIQISANAWRATILGSDAYFVYVEIDNDKVVVSQCNCPFDGTCKHEVAAYFAIREALQTEPNTDYRELFKHYKKQELVDILADIVSQSPALQMRFAPSKNKETIHTELIIEQAKNTLTKAVNSYLHSYSESVAEKMYVRFTEVLEQVLKCFPHERIFALELITLSYEQIDSLEDELPIWLYDQIYEDIDNCLHDLLALVSTNDEAILISNWLLQRFEQNAKAKKVHLFLLYSAIQISPISHAKYHIIDAIDRYAVYTNQAELSKELHFSLLMEVGSEEEITAFVQQDHLSIDLRNLLIDYCIREKRFEDALKLCADGIENLDAPPYIRTKWLRQAYNVHKQMNNITAQRIIAFELALGCELDDIEQLKALYHKEPELWGQVSADLVMMIEQKNSNSYQYPHVLEVLVEWERLLYYCKQHPQAILRFCQSLQPHYPQEVEQLLTQLLLEKSQKASNRSHYQELANILERLLALGYEEQARALIEHLRKTYPRKTALHDVLNWL